MPVYEIQHGNRTFEIEADAEPSPEDLDFALKQFIPSSNPVADVGRRVVKSANIGAKNAWESLARAADAVSDTLGFDKSENKFFRAHAEQAMRDAAAINTDPARDQEIKSMIAEGVGSAIPAITAGAASPVLGIATVAGQSGEATREQALAQGDSEELASEKAKIGRLGGGLMGLLPGTATRPGARVIERAATGAATGAGINAAQEAAMNLAVEGEVNPESVKRAAVVGGAMGGALGAASRSRPSRTSEAPVEPVSAADRAVETINAGIREQAVQATPEPVKHGFTPAELATELAKAKPEALENVKAQIARGDEVDFQYSVWDKEMVPEGAPRDVQIDIIPKNPDEAAVGGLGSTNRKVLAALGVDLPPVPDWVPPGSYTKADIEALIEQGPPSAGAEVVYEPAPKPLDATPEPSVTQTPEVGLGAAAPAEFQPIREFTTSVRNEVMDAEAIARGQPPAMAQARKSNPEVWDEAMRKIDEDQNYPDQLIAELKEKPRAIDAADQLVLAHRNIELQNQFNKAERNIAENIGTPDSLAADRAAQERILDEMIDVRNVIKQAGGSEVGRSLQIRQALLNEDFSLATMLAEQQVAKGEKLTPEETSAVRKQHEAIQKAEKELADYESPRPANERHLDEEFNRLSAKVEIAKEDFTGALEKERFKQKSKLQKAASKTVDAIDFIRAVMTTGELSFIGRQGFQNLAGHPIRTVRAIPDTIRALFSNEAVARSIDMKTRDDPFTKTAVDHGLFIDDPATPLNKHEEQIASKWAEKVPGIRNFNQAARVFLNRMRLESFKAMAEANPGIGDDGLKALASFANVSTGRGNLGKYGEQAAPLLRLAMFSPRFVASRIQYTLGTPLWGGNLASRKTIAREYARTLLGVAAFYSLYEMARREDKDRPPVSFDPRSSNFGKITLGKTTLDPLAGLSQAVVWETRNALTLADSLGIETGGQSVDGKGKLVSLRKPAFGKDDWFDMNARFGRSKLAPIPGAFFNGMIGENIAGEPTTWAGEAAGLVRPMTWWDLGQAFGEHDVPEYAAIAMMGLLGAGVQNQIDRTKPARQTIEEPVNTQTTLPSGKRVNITPAQ